MARDDRVAQLIQLLRDAEESGDDDLAQIVRLDLFKEFGLEMNQGGIMSVQGYNGGGRVKKPEYIPGQNVEKIKQGISQTKGIATRRMDPSTYKQWIEKLGPKFQKTELVRGKPKIEGDLHKFEKSLNKKGLTLWQDKSSTMKNAVTKELNSMLKAKGVEGIPYKNVGETTKRGLAENLASRARGFLGKYAERFSAATKKEWWEDALKLQEKADKKFGTKKLKKKLRWIAQQLKMKWPSIGIGTTMGLLSTSGFGAVLTKATALPYVTDVLGLTDIMGFKDVEPENTEPGYFEKLKREKYDEDADLSYFERIKKQNMRGGGLMDIDYMTRPVRGYAEGDEVKPYRQGQEENNEMVLNILETLKGVPLNVAKSILDKLGDIIPQRIKDRFEESEVQGMSVHDLNEHYRMYGIEEGDRILSMQREKKKLQNIFENPSSRQPGLEMNRGGIVSLDHLTRRL